MSGGLDWRDARARAAAAAPVQTVEAVSLDVAAGRVLAEDLRTPIPLPHYASSAMDGWAVRGDAPWGLVARRELEPGEATVTSGRPAPRPRRASPCWRPACS